MDKLDKLKHSTKEDAHKLIDRYTRSNMDSHMLRTKLCILLAKLYVKAYKLRKYDCAYKPLSYEDRLAVKGYCKDTEHNIRLFIKSIDRVRRAYVSSNRINQFNQYIDIADKIYAS